MTNTPTINVSEATTKELVEFYNEHSGGRPIKKFSDRNTAEMRVNLLIKVMREEAEDAAGITPEAPAPVNDDELATRRSTAIAKSWEDKAVHAKRRQRSGVEVDGVSYRSVRAAFVALDLPLKDHINFRMLLKATGKQKVDGRQWKIVPLNY